MVCLQIRVVFDGVKLYLLIQKAQRKHNVKISSHMYRTERFTKSSVLQNSFSDVESRNIFPEIFKNLANTSHKPNT